jgi:hypothetical protein
MMRNGLRPGKNTKEHALQGMALMQPMYTTAGLPMHCPMTLYTPLLLQVAVLALSPQKLILSTISLHRLHMRYVIRHAVINIKPVENKVHRTTLQGA